MIKLSNDHYDDIKDCAEDAKRIYDFVEKILGIEVNAKFYTRKNKAHENIAGRYSYTMHKRLISIYIVNCANLQYTIGNVRLKLLWTIVHEHMHAIQPNTDNMKVAYANDFGYHSVTENETELSTLRFIKSHLMVLMNVLDIPALNIFIIHQRFRIYYDIALALKNENDRKEAYTVPIEMLNAIETILSPSILNEISIDLYTESIFEKCIPNYDKNTGEKLAEKDRIPYNTMRIGSAPSSIEREDFDITPKDIVYRGYRNSSAEKEISSKSGSIVFVNNPNIADKYAIMNYKNNTFLKDNSDKAYSVMKAKLKFSNPLKSYDPFIYFKDLENVMPKNIIIGWAVQMFNWIKETNFWKEDFKEFKGIEELLKSARASDFWKLYTQAYPLLDDYLFIEDLKKAGFDSAIYRGSGVGLASVEIRVFDKSQVTIL